MKRHAIIPMRALDYPKVIVQDGQLLGTSDDLNQRVRCVNLPNGSLCADFLLLPSQESVGVCVGVSDGDLPEIRSLFAATQPNRVTIRERRNGVPLRYLSYPEWNWLEVTWSDGPEAVLVEAQSNQVLWIVDNEDPQRITAMVLEDMDYIQSEVGGTFALSPTPDSSRPPTAHD